MVVRIYPEPNNILPIIIVITLQTKNIKKPHAKRQSVVVNDLMQKNYVYLLTEPIGENFSPGFHPELTPKEMLRLGVFGGKYMTDCTAEFPSSWFKDAKLCSKTHDPSLNYFGVNASQPLSL